MNSLERRSTRNMYNSFIKEYKAKNNEHDVTYKDFLFHMESMGHKIIMIDGNTYFEDIILKEGK